MSYESPSRKNKQPKVHFEQYLHNFGEPQDDVSKDLPAELQAELLDDSQAMRRHFRHFARLKRGQL